MKKLMIAALTVAFSAVAGAATVNWGAQDISAYPGGLDKDRNTYMAYLFDTSAGHDAIATAIKGGDMSVLSKALGSKAVTSAGKVLLGKALNAPYDIGDYVTAFAVVLNNATPANATYVLVTDEATSASGVSSQGAVSVDLGSQASASWAQVAPEPTSGLLLLIGVAGLALRRRRA